MQQSAVEILPDTDVYLGEEIPGQWVIDSRFFTKASVRSAQSMFDFTCLFSLIRHKE